MAEEFRLWPQDFRTAAECAFGGQLNNTAFAVVNRRVNHAFDVWATRYAMTPDQYVYAWELLAWAVRSSAKDAYDRILAGGIKHPVMYVRRAVANGMENVVHDPTAHEGFRRRANTVNVLNQLEEMVA